MVGKDHPQRHQSPLGCDHSNLGRGGGQFQTLRQEDSFPGGLKGTEILALDSVLGVFLSRSCAFLFLYVSKFDGASQVAGC